MMKLERPSLAGVLANALTACTLIIAVAHAQTTDTKALDRPTGPGTESMGYVVGAISRAADETAFDTQTLFFRGKGNGQRGSIVFELSPKLIPGPVIWRKESERTRVDFQSSPCTGQTFLVPLPAGDYEFHQYEFFRNSNMHRPDGAVSVTWKAKKEFSYPFSVEAGKATYVGDFCADAITTKNFLGLVRFQGGKWAVTDQRARDLPLLRNRLPANVEVGSISGVQSLPTTQE